ncbi:MAG: tRNA (uridine(54)-C5)-methyltransferase TrmA [Candidatus Symbiodolus clandestinus]
MTPLILPIERYSQLLTDKHQQLQQRLMPYQAPALACFASPMSHYRQRAEFRLWHNGDDLFHAMWDGEARCWSRVDQFPAASLIINRLMAELLSRVKLVPILRHKLFRADYLSTLKGEGLVTLLYHRLLSAEWTKQAEWLQEQLQQALAIPVVVIGRAAKQCLTLDRNYIDETLTIQGRIYHYRQREGLFTQPNTAINIQMLSWASQQLADTQSDLLELYCGSGNFTLPLARHCRQIMATEVVKAAVQAAQYNLSMNHIDNVQVVRLSACELMQAYQGDRSFRRLAAVDWQQFAFQTVLVDPPRCGLDDSTLQWIQRFERVIYFSCNPQSLVDNLTVLCQTHNITEAALFDQFPYTPHSECGMILRRQS